VSDEQIEVGTITDEIDSILGTIEEDTDSEESTSDTPGTSRSSSQSTAERVLDVVRNDGQASLSEISERVGVSKPTARKYVNQLEDRGVIVGYSADVDPQKLSEMTIAMVRFVVDAQNYDEAKQTLLELDSARSLFSTHQKTELLAEIRASGFIELGEVIDKTLQKTDAITTAHTTILEERVK